MNAVRSEWTKFRSIPSNIPTLLVAVGLMVGLGALVARGASQDYVAGGRGGVFDSTNISMYGGFLFAQITVGALGVLIATSEYATGMIRTSMTVVPRRARLLSAKIGTFGLLALLTGELSSFAAFFLGQRVIASTGGPAAALSSPEVLRAVVGMGLVWTLVALIGVALGVLMKSTTSAITVLVTVNFVIPIMGPRLLPDSAGDWIGAYWPISAGLRVTTTVPDTALLDPWTGFGVFAAFTAVLLVIAFTVFGRRDA